MTDQTEIVSDLKRFADLQPYWDRLWERCNGYIFQHHRWIAAWLEASYPSARPCIAIQWREGEIVAAIPLAVVRRLGLRVLEWSAQAMSDYCDALATPGAMASIVPLWNAVWNAGGFDLVSLGQIRPDATARRCIDKDWNSSSGFARQSREQRCFGVHYAGRNADTWFRSLGKKGRNNFWRGERIIAGIGGDVAFRSIGSTDPSIGADLRRILALKRAMLRTRKKASLLLTRSGDPLEAMLDAAASTGLMRLFLLTSGGRVAAASVNFVRGNSMQAYLTSYDNEFERGSPGMLLIINYVRWAFDNGLTEVDFLRGDEPFKVRLANIEVVLNNYVAARTFIGTAALAAHRWRARLARDSQPGEGGSEISSSLAVHLPQLATEE